MVDFFGAAADRSVAKTGYQTLINAALREYVAGKIRIPRHDDTREFGYLLGMKMAKVLVPEFDREMSGVRKTLERVPDGKFDWRPHAKSMELGRLANHIADIPGWTMMTFDRDTFDLAEFENPSLGTREELLAMFDKNVVRARAVLSEVSDEVAGGTWSMTGHGQVFFTSPKMEVIRTWVLNHIVHHRAQMGVYLRLLNIPVPGVYGPSADEM